MATFNIKSPFIEGSIVFTDSEKEEMPVSVNESTDNLILTVSGADVIVWYDNISPGYVRSSQKFTGTVYYRIGQSK